MQRLAERFWFVPAALCAVAVLVAETLVTVDEVTSELDVPGWMQVLFYRVGESGSRDLLGAIATSSLAVAGTTFSITMAVLALTSSTYGPRLVRNFMADRGNQLTAGQQCPPGDQCLRAGHRPSSSTSRGRSSPLPRMRTPPAPARTLVYRHTNRAWRAA